MSSLGQGAHHRSAAHAGNTVLITHTTEEHRDFGHGGTLLPGRYSPHVSEHSLETRVVAAGRPPREPDAPINTPIVPVSTLHAGGVWEYAREGAPTTAALEQALADVEHPGSLAVAYASGMAAANALMDTWERGTTVIAPAAVYTGVAVRLRELDERGDISLHVVDIDHTSEVFALLSSLPAGVLWIESPTNPLLQVADLPALLAAAQGWHTVVDNTFATPVLQQPLAMGADVVLHSVTKSLSGHSDLLMGALITCDPELAEALRVRRILLGAAPSAFDCYLALRGLRTLVLRVERAQASAQVLAEKLRNHPAVTRVRYPGWGTIIAIETVSADFSDSVCESTRVWTYATSLGGVESLLERRRRWPLESSVVPESLLRLSVGIENVDDLWRDLSMALDQARAWPTTAQQ